MKGEKQKRFAAKCSAGTGSAHQVSHRVVHHERHPGIAHLCCGTRNTNSAHRLTQTHPGWYPHGYVEPLFAGYHLPHQRRRDALPQRRRALRLGDKPHALRRPCEPRQPAGALSPLSYLEHLGGDGQRRAARNCQAAARLLACAVRGGRQLRQAPAACICRPSSRRASALGCGQRPRDL